MARTKNTLPLRSAKTGRNERSRPSKPEAPRRPSAWDRVNWGRVRLWGVSLIFAGLWLLLWARAYQVQIIRGPRLAEEARRQHITTEVVAGKRGNILDRHGNVLARSVDAQSVYVRPRQIKDLPETALFLSKTLSLPPEQIRKLVNSPRPFVWIARKINQRLADAVKSGNRPGVFLTREYERVDPFQHLGGQLLGFVNVDDEGIEGLEKSFDETLSGRKTRRTLQRDAAGRRLQTSGEALEDLTGENVALTLDTQVQFFAEAALAEGAEQFGARWAGCMVVDVPTGDILAWAEYPFFNPNRPHEFSLFVRRNKIAMDALEQGSTIKPFLMAAALQEKVVTPETPFNCEKGKWKLRDKIIRDTHPYDTLPAHKIIRVSSNIGVAKIGLKLGAQKYHGYLSRLGFGSRSSLPLAGENRGILRDPRQWAEIDLATASFGQSFSATVLQMAQAYSCLANDGVRKDLRLVVSDDARPETGKRVFNQDVMSQVRGMLREAVEEEGGTGSKARIAGLTVGGKTGTAQKASGDSYGAGRVASFVGMVPVEQPRYLVVVVFDEPSKNQYGGIVAAPVFQNVALRTMAYHGMLPENPPLKVAAEAKVTRKGADKAAAKTSARQAPQISPVQAAAKNSRGAPGAAPAVSGQSGADGAEVRVEVTDVSRVAVSGSGIPQVVGLSLRRAVEGLAQRGLVPVVKGRGNIVVRQTPAAGSLLPQDPAKAECVLWLGDQS